MNIIKSILGVILLAILIVMGYKVGQIAIELSTPVTPKTNTAQVTIPEQPQTSTDLRWNHLPLTVYIDDSLIKQKNPDYATDAIRALDMWGKTGTVSFSVVYTSDADITIKWVPSLKEKATDTLGNTDIKFINISRLGVIQKAEIELLTRSDSRELNSDDMTNLALHEIGHAIGLHHTNEDDIMNPVLIIPSKSVKDISASYINNLEELYNIPAKPDLKMVEVNVTKSSFTRLGRDYFYLNISTSIQNTGLIDAGNFKMRVSADNTVVNDETLQKLEFGNTLNIFQGNLRVDGNFTTIQISIDSDNEIDELDETNNLVNLLV